MVFQFLEPYTPYKIWLWDVSEHPFLNKFKLLEQNVFDNTTLSFDDNKVWKMLIGYANICSSVQDNRQKFKIL